MEEGSCSNGFPFLEKSQARARCNTQPEQIGRITFVRSSRGQANRRLPWQMGYDGYSGDGTLLHHRATGRKRDQA